jgi:hypothetical protein
VIVQIVGDLHADVTPSSFEIVDGIGSAVVDGDTRQGTQSAFVTRCWTIFEAIPVPLAKNLALDPALLMETTV